MVTRTIRPVAGNDGLISFFFFFLFLYYLGMKADNDTLLPRQDPTPRFFSFFFSCVALSCQDYIVPYNVSCFHRLQYHGKCRGENVVCVVLKGLVLPFGQWQDHT